MTEREAIDLLYDHIRYGNGTTDELYCAIEVLKTAVVELEIYRLNDKYFSNENNS